MFFTLFATSTYNHTKKLGRFAQSLISWTALQASRSHDLQLLVAPGQTLKELTKSAVVLRRINTKGTHVNGVQSTIDDLHWWQGQLIIDKKFFKEIHSCTSHRRICVKRLNRLRKLGSGLLHGVDQRMNARNKLTTSQRFTPSLTPFGKPDSPTSQTSPSSASDCNVDPSVSFPTQSKA